MGRAPCAAALAAIACSLAWVPATDATVPPKNCGTMTVKGKRYQVKADQMRCDTAKTYTRRYLSRHARPSGYHCSDFGASTKLKFRCAKGVRVFFAIKR